MSQIFLWLGYAGWTVFLDKSTFSRRKDFGQETTPSTAVVVTDSGTIATVGADGAPPPPEVSEEEIRLERETTLGALQDKLRALIEMVILINQPLPFAYSFASYDHFSFTINHSMN
jgi:hypothetical protein